MKNITPMLPGFHLQTLRRKPRSAQQKLAEKMALLKQKSLKQIGEVFEKFIPSSLLKPEQAGTMSRRTLFSKENTFWAFLSQILDADGGCKEVIRKLQSYASIKGIKVPSSSTASYCTARTKLEEQMLSDILEHTADRLEEIPDTGLLNNRRVIVVDGTGVTIPDTPENQEIWPQPSSQKAGCGFPSARICACFSLESGALLSYAIGNKKSHELLHFRQQWETFKQGDIFLGDKGFCSYFDQATLKEKGIDSVITLARRAPVRAARSLKMLDPDDLLITWPRPKYAAKLSYSKDEWGLLPEELTLRQIRVTVKHPGFRTQGFYLVTTLLDAEQYPAEELAELYFKRWDVELFFHDIKTTMGMNVLRCRTPKMVRKEILMHFIAYNCVRRLMYEAAEEARMEVRVVSFKGSLQALRSWEPHLNQAKISKAEQFRLISDLYEAMTNTPIRQRPGRSEPRCVKRRPKNYQRMTSPRKEMKVVPHRSKYCATTP
ncbi:MAG: transposase [Desulfuromonadales bacterium C00003094]|nr:MAG: transposase [Desulfuromonadales bacterium C00003094]